MWMYVDATRLVWYLYHKAIIIIVAMQLHDIVSLSQCSQNILQQNAAYIYTQKMLNIYIEKTKQNHMPIVICVPDS